MMSALLERFHEWRDRRSALKDLRRQISIDAPYEGMEIGKIIGRIKFAAYRDHQPDGLAAWHDLRTRAPDLAITSTNVLRSLLDLRQFDLVEQSLEEAMRKYPGQAELAHLYAELAQRQGQWDKAAERWAYLRQHHPGLGGSYSFGSIALMQLERYDEADRMLEARTKAMPDDIVAGTAYARVAEAKGDFEEAILRWRRMQETIFNVDGWIGEAKVLSQLGRVDEAMEVLKAAAWKFATSPLPHVERAWIIQKQGDLEASLREWAVVRERYPHAGVAYTAAAWLLRDNNRRDEAEALLLRYVERQASDPEPTLEYARFAHGRDWPEACRRWALVRDRYPERKEGYTWGADALDANNQPEEAAAVRALTP